MFKLVSEHACYRSASFGTSAQADLLANFELERPSLLAFRPHLASHRWPLIARASSLLALAAHRTRLCTMVTSSWTRSLALALLLLAPFGLVAADSSAQAYAEGAGSAVDPGDGFT